MLRSIGKLMQVLALLILPVAMIVELTAEMRAFTQYSNLSVMLIALVFGVALFGLGRILEGYAR
jgi:uncharacterized membrane protein YczE